jgi:hypothetical protein
VGKKFECLEEICDLLSESSSNDVRLTLLDLTLEQLIFLKNAIEKQIKTTENRVEKDIVGFQDWNH